MQISSNHISDTGFTFRLMNENHTPRQFVEIFTWFVFFSSGRTSSANSSAQGRIKPWRQETSQTPPCPLQPPANPQNGCPVSSDTHRPQERDSARQTWHGFPELCSSRRGHWEFAAMPTRVREGVTTTFIMPSWWEWAASWEPAKCRTLATGSISWLVRVAEKTRPPLIPEALIVMDELYTSKTPTASLSISPFIYLLMYYW